MKIIIRKNQKDKYMDIKEKELSEIISIVSEPRADDYIYDVLGVPLISNQTFYRYTNKTFLGCPIYEEIKHK